MTDTRRYSLALIVIIIISIPLKLWASQAMAWDIDIVPVIERNFAWLQGGDFPAYGTLSSVAAYNPPALQWLHLPVWILTGNVWWTIILTMMTFNVLSTIAVYCLGVTMFNPRIGLAAATLFTLSEVGISSSYTAWAQQLLPGLYAMTMLFLWQWIKQERGFYLALAGMVATFTFMTHFSAILLFPAMLLVALVSGATWQWRWLALGAVGCLLLLLPYGMFQVQRDFADLKAFIRQDVLVDDATFAQYQYLKPEGGTLPADYRQPPIADDVPSQRIDTQATTPNSTSEPEAHTPSRNSRIVRAILQLPSQFWRGLHITFDSDLRYLPDVLEWMLWLPAIGFWLSIVYVVRDVFKRGFAARTAPTTLLLLFVLVIIVGFVGTRNIDQPTYFMGLFSLQMLLAVAPFALFTGDKPARWLNILLIAVVVAYTGIIVVERMMRLIDYDNSEYSRFNVSIYRNVADATNIIADSWQGDETITVSYDILPEMRNLWWVIPWHSIDASYRMGMNFDLLLHAHHNLRNTNRSPFGLADDADFIIIYEPARERYDLSQYAVQQVGTIYILQSKDAS